MTNTWRNWAGTVESHPAQVAFPASVAEVAQLLTSARERGLPARAVGSGHSFTGAAYTDGVMINLRRMTGMLALDRATQRVRVRAGTSLRELNRLLDGAGLALPNLGDIDRQTVAGAISTGTHGSGLAFPGLASYVTGLQVVLADGSIADCSAQERAELFEAARLGLGAFGVISEVEFACVPTFRVRAVERQESFAAVLPRLADVAAGHDHVELFWFPQTDSCVASYHDRLAPHEAGSLPMSQWQRVLSEEVIRTRLFEVAHRVGEAAPALTPHVNRTSARLMPRREFTDVGHRVYVEPRHIRFRESEYALGLPEAVEVLDFLRSWFERTRESVTFPVEVRFAAADDVWLSPAYGRASAYLAIRQYHRRDHEAAFRAFEDACDQAGGRPHWGKLHRMDAESLRARYPRFAQALAVRDALDPQRLFRNPYLTRVLGA